MSYLSKITDKEKDETVVSDDQLRITATLMKTSSNNIDLESHRTRHPAQNDCLALVKRTIVHIKYASTLLVLLLGSMGVMIAITGYLNHSPQSTVGDLARSPGASGSDRAARRTQASEQQKYLSLLDHPRSCPNNPEAAAAAGCVFDVVQFAWKLPDCHDAQLMEQFLQEAQWTWSHTPNNLTLIAEEEIRSGMVCEGFVTGYYHLAHCFYMWLELRKDVQLGRPRDDTVSGLDHTLHCMGSFLDGYDQSQYNTDWKVHYPMCGRAVEDQFDSGDYFVPGLSDRTGSAYWLQVSDIFSPAI